MVMVPVSRFRKFYKDLEGLKYHYEKTSVTVADITSALERAYEYGADSPRAYAKRILEDLLPAHSGEQ